MSPNHIEDVIAALEQYASPAHREGMARFGIDNSSALGVAVPNIRKVAKLIGMNQELSLKLWESSVHEVKLLAAMTGDPAMITPQQMDTWVNGFYSWDICDTVCALFDRTPYVIEKALEYSLSEKEFVKRAGFALMAEYAVHDKKAPDEVFVQFFPVIEREAWDDRNFVKKAINWALRQIGKRNDALKPLAIATAQRILAQNTKAARWIATNALAELSKR